MPCVFARGMLGAEAEEASRPGFDSGGSDLGGGCEYVEVGDWCQIGVRGGPLGEVPQERAWGIAVVDDATFVTSQ